MGLLPAILTIFLNGSYGVDLGSLERGPYSGCVSLICPIVMLLLLLFVTGVPAAEASSIQSRGDAYRAYQSRTNAFFLGPKKNMIAEKLLELGLVPDLVIRKKIRILLRERLKSARKIDQKAFNSGNGDESYCTECPGC